MNLKVLSCQQEGECVFFLHKFIQNRTKRSDPPQHCSSSIDDGDDRLSEEKKAYSDEEKGSKVREEAPISNMFLLLFPITVTQPIQDSFQPSKPSFQRHPPQAIMYTLDLSQQAKENHSYSSTRMSKTIICATSCFS